MDLTNKLGLKVPNKDIDSLEEYYEYLRYNLPLIDEEISKRIVNQDDSPTLDSSVTNKSLVFLDTDGVYKLAQGNLVLDEIGVADTDRNVVMYGGITSIPEDYNPGSLLYLSEEIPGAITTVKGGILIGKMLANRRMLKFNTISGYQNLHLSGELFIDSTSAISLPTGTTAQRPIGESGKIRFNTTLGFPEVYNGSAWGPIGAGAKGAGSNAVFFENDMSITGDYSISTGKNAMSAGPISIDNGISVAIPDGSFWTIV